MAVAIEWFTILESSLPSYKNFNTHIERIANSKGSVGKLIPKPNPTSFKVIESGVKKTASITSLSNEKMANKPTMSTKGNSESQ